MAVEKELFEILVCPKCKGKLEEQEDKLVCKNCSSEYLVRDNIPILLN